MKVFLLLCIQLSVHLAEVSGKREVLSRKQGETVTLPCTYDEQDFSLQNHYFAWQRQGIVIYWFEGGQVKQKRDQVSSVGKLERGDLSIQLRDITPHDEGLYTCYIFKNEQHQRKKVDEHEVLLLVNARYSTPTIMAPHREEVQAGELVNLTCHSSGGYPKPTVNWTDGENRPFLGVSQDEFSQDGVLRLWNISSTIQVKVSANSSFACTVVNTRTGERVTSAAWVVNTPAPSAVPPSAAPTVSQAVIIVPCLVVLCIVVFLGLLLCIKMRSRYAGVPSKEVAEPSEANQIEMNVV